MAIYFFLKDSDDDYVPTPSKASRGRGRPRGSSRSLGSIVHTLKVLSDDESSRGSVCAHS